MSHKMELLQDFVQEHKRLPAKTVTIQPIRLGEWLQKQRKLQQEATKTLDRLCASKS